MTTLISSNWMPLVNSAFGELADAAVHRPLELQQRDRHHGDGSGEQCAATGCQHADEERGDGCHRRGQSHDAVHAGCHDVPGQDQQRHHGQDDDQNDRSPPLRQQTAQAAEQADQRKRAQAGHAVSVGNIALMPAAFQSDEQARRQRDTDAHQIRQ
jgi:hypothetical protein